MGDKAPPFGPGAFSWNSKQQRFANKNLKLHVKNKAAAPTTGEFWKHLNSGGWKTVSYGHIYKIGYKNVTRAELGPSAMYYYGGYDSTLSPGLKGPNYFAPFPQRAGYDFMGWYLDARFKTQFKGLDEKSTGDKTLYARWQKSKAPVSSEIQGIGFHTYPGYEYQIGQSFDASGVRITVDYKNGDTAIVDKGFTMSGFYNKTPERNR